MKTTRFLLPILFAAAASCFAQDQAPPTFYKLDFVLKELDGGKVVNSRAYSSLLSSADKSRGSIRTGSRVPMASGGGGTQYIDVGTNIDFSFPKEMADRLVLDLAVDVSGAAAETSGMAPVVRQNKWQSTVVVPLRKATTVFTSDDPTSKRQLQLELTATPIK